MLVKFCLPPSRDSIAIFAVGADGTLTFVGEEWTRGDYPRSFTFDPTGGFLFCCNQRADHIAVFRVDKDTGKLVFTGHYTPVGSLSQIVCREIMLPLLTGITDIDGQSVATLLNTGAEQRSLLAFALPNGTSCTTICCLPTIPDDAQSETKQQSAQAIQEQAFWP